jgi:hypothetical protein
MYIVIIGLAFLPESIVIIGGLISVALGIYILLKIETKPVIICCKQGLIIRQKKKETAIWW